MAESLEDALNEKPTRVVVIGGGAAGLVAARDLARPGFEVTVLEAGDSAGGSVASVELAGIRLDSGAESFATRGGHVAALIEELGLADEVVRPNVAGAWLQLPGRAVPMPKAGIMGIPSSPLAKDVIAAIGWGGALRAYLDRLMPLLKIGQERDFGRLVRRRMGDAVLQNLVAPVTTGVYAASPFELDVAAAAPGLNPAMTRTGSLSGAVAELRESAKAGSAVGGLVGGMATLVDALVADATARGARIMTGSRVVALRRGDSAVAEAAGAGGAGEEPDVSRWLVECSDGEVTKADSVLIATPARAALALLAAADDSLGFVEGLDWPHDSRVELVTLVLDAPALDAAPRGTGLLVADTVDEEKIAAKAMTHVSAKWTWLAERLPAGRHVVRLSYGRAGRANPLDALDEHAVLIRALRDCATLLNIPIVESMVVEWSRTSWTNAFPIAARGEKDRIAAVREAVSEVDGLETTGSWLTGTGLASVVPDAKQVAARIRGLRWKELTEKD